MCDTGTMLFGYHLLFAIGAAFFNVSSYVPYVRDIFRGTTKPHPFTWFVWALINMIAFFAQLAGGGGVGAWVTATVAAGCLVIALLSLSRGERRITAFDWVCFCGALLSLVLWRLSDDPFLAIVFVTLTDGLAAVPTFRKGYLRPFEETPSTYLLGVIGFALEIVAFESFNATTALYPAFIVVMNIALVVLLLLRRKSLGRVSSTV